MEEETVFGQPHEECDLIEEIDEAIRAYWNENLQPVGVVWVDRDQWALYGSNIEEHELFWSNWGCRVIFLDDFFKDKEFDFCLKP